MKIEPNTRHRTTLRLRSWAELSARAALPARSNRTGLVKHLAILWITQAYLGRVVHRFLALVDNYLQQ
jgi:hypothetical protein